MIEAMKDEDLGGIKINFNRENRQALSEVYLFSLNLGKISELSEKSAR